MSKVKVTKEALQEVAKQAIRAFVAKMIAESDQIVELVLAKNTDYGDAWQRFDIFTPLVRLNDKLLRVETLADGRQALVASEKIDETIVDIVGYGLLELLKLKHNKESGDKTPEEIIINNLPDVDESDYEPTREDLDWICFG